MNCKPCIDFELRKRAARCLAFVFAAIFLVSGAALAQKAGGTLRAMQRDQPPSASLQEETTNSTLVPFMPVFNNLVVFDQLVSRTDESTIKPDLAKSWAWSDGGRTLTFKLNEGVKWHDGKPFTSADVKCTWDTLAGKKDMDWRKNPRKDWYRNLKEVTTPGPYEVRFALERPQPSFLTFLAIGWSAVYPCHVDGRVMRTKPIGTGPFKVAENKPGEIIRLVKNPDYFKKGKPYLDAIDYRLVPNPATRVLSFVTGMFDVTVQDISLEMEKDIKSQAPKAVCDLGQGLSQGQLLYNPKFEPLKDQRVRLAIALAIDRKSINNVMTRGRAQLGGVFVPPPVGIWGLTMKQLADAPGYGPDPEKNLREARELMKAAGYSPSKPLKLQMMVVNRPFFTQATIMFIDQMRKIGIEATMDAVEISVWTQRVSSRSNYEISYWGSSMAIDDPDVILYEGYMCGSLRNYTEYCDKRTEAMIEEQSSTIDPAKRKKLVQEIDHRLQMAAVRPILHGTVEGLCWQPNVKNIVRGGSSLYTHYRFEDVWLDK